MAGARILILKQRCLKGFVEAEPIFAAIREANPGVPIDLLTTPQFGRLAKGAPYFDRVLAAEPVADKAALREFINQLKKISYEQIYDLDGSKQTLEIRSALTGFRGPRWVGPRRSSGKSASRVGLGLDGYGLRRMMLDAKVSVEERLPNLYWALDGRKDAANMKPSWFGISGAFALLLPSTVESRRWPASHYAKLAQELAREGLFSVIIGPEELAEEAREISRLAGKNGTDAAAGTVIDLTGKADLAQLAMLAQHAQFFVAGASEELHLCVAVGCSGVVLMHPSDTDEAHSLFGRDIIKLVSSDMAKLEPETALSMLKNMGLLASESLRPQPTASAWG